MCVIFSVTCMFLVTLPALRFTSAVMPKVSLATQRSLLICKPPECQNKGQNVFEVAGKLVKIETKKDSLDLHCDGDSVLDSPILPRFDPAMRVSHLSLWNCALPLNESIRDVLSKLNASMECSFENNLERPLRNLTLWWLPVSPSLMDRHFNGLECLTSLEIYGDILKILNPEQYFFSHLNNLRLLALHLVVLQLGELDVLPPKLRVLDMEYEAGDVNAARRLPMSSTLAYLRLCTWRATQAVPVTKCDVLSELVLDKTEVVSLPHSWLSNCTALRKLFIKNAPNLTNLPGDLLLGTTALTELTITDTLLDSLPTGLLLYSPNLTKIDLSNNRLIFLPSNLFEGIQRVQKITISNNNLENFINPLVPLKDLEELDLGNNRRLFYRCEADGYSSIKKSRKLKKLTVFHTRVTVICRDWLEDMPYLAYMDFSHSNVELLSFTDLQRFKRKTNLWTTLDLTSTNVRLKELTRENYLAASNLSAKVNIGLSTMWTVKCSCESYWTRRALDLQLPLLRHLGDLQCDGSNTRLHDISPETMWCKESKECEAADLVRHGCKCYVRPDDDPTRALSVVLASCERGKLESVPLLPQNPTRLYNLRLAHNSITALSPHEVQYNLKELDLSYNPLREVGQEAAAKLSNTKIKLHLAGNRLECSCLNMPLLRAIQDRSITLSKSSAGTCRDGRTLYAASVMDCSTDIPLATWLVIVIVILSVVMVFGIAGVAVCWSRERRFFARAVLHRYGWKWRLEFEEDDDREYDVFLTYSHKDKLIAREVLTRLEPQYQFCIHERDWIPGVLIPEQIEESVRDSRRTVALVSQHFLASGWARAEFREAHAAAMLEDRPRLIVILLEEAEPLLMDELLQRYVASRTYLRWGDILFWDKLAVVLPKPRKRPTDAEQAYDFELAALSAREIFTVPSI